MPTFHAIYRTLLQERIALHCTYYCSKVLQQGLCRAAVPNHPKPVSVRWDSGPLQGNPNCFQGTSEHFAAEPQTGRHLARSPAMLLGDLQNSCHALNLSVDNCMVTLHSFGAPSVSRIVIFGPEMRCRHSGQPCKSGRKPLRSFLLL